MTEKSVMEKTADCGAVCEATEDYRAGRSSQEELTFTILRQLGTLTTSGTGWTKELNLVSWNGGKPKYDIRDWSADHGKMSKGLRLTPFEAKQLRSCLNAVDLDQVLADAVQAQGNGDGSNQTDAAQAQGKENGGNPADADAQF